MNTQKHYGWTSPQVILGLIAMAIIVAASNYLVTTPVTSIFGVDVNAATGLPFSDYIQWAAFTYPVAFLVTDVMNRVYGADAAQRVIFVGFMLGVVLSLLGVIAFVQSMDGMADATALSLIQSKGFWLTDGRIPVASGTAFLVAQLLDVKLFNRLRAGSWWTAPLVSSLVAGTLDSVIFWSMAFAGTGEAIFPGGWVNFAVADWAIKIGVTVLMLVPFRAMTWNMRQRTV